jgi:hypothetical protein
MDMEKRHLYRIDPMKVQQKIFDLYPKGSEARELIIKEQKMQEYKRLTRTLSSFPIAVAQETLKKSHKVITLAVLRVLAGMGWAVGMIHLLPLATTVTQTLIILSGSMLGLLYALVKVVEIGVTIYSMRTFKSTVENIEARLSKLKKDILP